MPRCRRRARPRPRRRLGPGARARRPRRRSRVSRLRSSRRASTARRIGARGPAPSVTSSASEARSTSAAWSSVTWPRNSTRPSATSLACRSKAGRCAPSPSTTRRKPGPSAAAASTAHPRPWASPTLPAKVQTNSSVRQPQRLTVRVALGRIEPEARRAVRHQCDLAGRAQCRDVPSEWRGHRRDRRALRVEEALEPLGERGARAERSALPRLRRPRAIGRVRPSRAGRGAGVRGALPRGATGSGGDEARTTSGRGRTDPHAVAIAR